MNLHFLDDDDDDDDTVRKWWFYCKQNVYCLREIDEQLRNKYILSQEQDISLPGSPEKEIKDF